MEKVRYMISDAAAAVDVETHVLRYWEDELGLDVPRNELGHRYYTRDNIKQFLRIKELKEKGYQLRAIRDMLHSDAPGEPLNPPNPAVMEKSVQPVNYTNITNQTVISLPTIQRPKARRSAAISGISDSPDWETGRKRLLRTLSCTRRPANTSLR